MLAAWEHYINTQHSQTLSSRGTVHEQPWIISWKTFLRKFSRPECLKGKIAAQAPGVWEATHAGAGLHAQRVHPLERTEKKYKVSFDDEA